MKLPRFIHLRVHTEYSLLQGAVPLKKLVHLASQAAMPAVAMTDTNAMFGALEFAVAARDAGVQPIIGCQVALGYESAAPGERRPDPAPLVLLVAERGGIPEPAEAELVPLSRCGRRGAAGDDG